jgi:ligand-binding sensor domain-containing protein
MINAFTNEINVSVSSLAWSSKRQTIFGGTETKFWIQSYDTGNEGWRFEHVTGLIDAPITSLVYNDMQDELWIGQSTGITLLSPVVMLTGRLHWFFARLT